MFNITYFSLLTNKLRNCFIQRPQEQRRFTYAERYERDSMTCILERIKTNSNHSAKASQLLNFAIAHRAKEIIEKLLHKKYCSWLDLLKGHQTSLQEPLASLLRPLNICTIRDLAHLRNVPNSDLIKLLNKLNTELHKHECRAH